MNKTVAAVTLGVALLGPVIAGAAEPLPSRGLTMAQVRADFGAPQRVQAAVGNPPITRWHYPGYTVYFEHDLLLDTVLDRDRPAQPIRHTTNATTAGHSAPVDSQAVQRRHKDDSRRVSGEQQARPDPSAKGNRQENEPVPAASVNPRSKQPGGSVESHLRFDPTTGRLKIIKTTDHHR